MMNKYDQILQIFESQKDEISIMSNKINELEKTNLFLMRYIEKKNHLPAICDISDIERYRELAVDRECTLSTARQRLKIDETFCETSLEASFEGQEVTEEAGSGQGNLGDRWGEVGTVELRQCLLSPVVRRDSGGVVRSVLGSEEHSGEPPSVPSVPSGSSEERKETVISASLRHSTESSNNNVPLSSNNSGRFHIFPQTLTPYNKLNSPKQSQIIQSSELSSVNIDNDNKLKDAIDHLITTLEERKSRLYDSSETSSFSEQLKQASNKMTIGQLLINKDTILSDLDDKHTQMKLLLTSQQMKADLVHRKLESNNRKMMDDSDRQLAIQNNSSNNKVINNKQNITKKRHDEVKDIEINHEIIPQFSELKIRRQKVLDKLNNQRKEEAFLDPKVKRGFTKFSALVKGYIVRTLLETDKVRRVIITIKDTAQMALSIRQETLSGNGVHPGDSLSYNNRRNHQETVLFQHRLVSQLKHALNELHAIFFIWSSYSRMSLLRNHINQLISSAEKYQTVDVNDGQGQFRFSILKTKKTAPLSSATVKRRQKMALRSANTSSKENGSKNSCSWPSQRKCIYSSPYSCKVSHPRSANGQLKNAIDKKFRKNKGHHINTVSTCSKLNTGTIVSNGNDASKDSVPKSKPNIPLITVKKNCEPEHQGWITPKTITTSICSQGAGDGHAYKSGFVTAMLGKQNCLYGVINVEEACKGVEPEIHKKASVSANNDAETQVNTNNSVGGNTTYKIINGLDNGENDPSHKSCNNSKSYKNINDISKVEVDIEDPDYSVFFKDNSNLTSAVYNKHSYITEDPIDNVVLVDITQLSSESDSIGNELKSTYNSNTNHCLNKPTVTVNNTKYTQIKTKPINNVASSSNSSSKHIPLPIQSTVNFDFSTTNNIIPCRTFKIRKRIIASNGIHTSSTSHS